MSNDKNEQPTDKHEQPDQPQPEPAQAAEAPPEAEQPHAAPVPPPVPPPAPAPPKQPKMVHAKAWVAGLAAAGLLLVGGLGGALIASAGDGHHGKDRYMSRFDQRQDRFGDRGPDHFGPGRGGGDRGAPGYDG
ncbi:hypothetical protein [Allokutzneria albata]|uniref:Uncharacterized protein n=1 Tax=Allokutzneria albata TaxID=211114 RepID=A0A1G9WMU3_ALLAB|nr:hypothetical protein [Allokutzneria albata]SDM85486.1 hypothetical protein SAMN04489726_3688 [Allokutzneria albata]